MKHTQTEISVTVLNKKNLVYQNTVFMYPRHLNKCSIMCVNVQALLIKSVHRCEINVFNKTAALACLLLIGSINRIV